MKYSLILIIFVLVFSCGKIPVEEGESTGSTRIGDIYAINPNDKLSLSESNLIRKICSELKSKQSSLYAKYYPNPEQQFTVETLEKNCDDEKAVSNEFKGVYSYDGPSQRLSLSALGANIMMFNDIIDHTNVNLQTICSNMTDDELPRQALLGSDVLKSITMISNSSSRCGAAGSQVCISIATAFAQSVGNYKVNYEDVFVLSRENATNTLEVRRDLYRKCDDGKNISIRSQSLR